MSPSARNGLTLLNEERPVESFEQLDAALCILTVRNWAVLGVLFLTLLSFGLFSWFYEAPLKVEGRGIILERDRDDRDPLLQVTAPASGRLAVVKVKIGDTVEAGDVLGEIDQSDLRDQIEEARDELSRLTSEDERFNAFEDQEAAALAQALRELERTLKRNLDLDRSRLETARQIAKGDLRLKSQRMLNNIDALKSRGDADAIESQVGSTESRLLELKNDQVRDETARQRDKLKRKLGIEAARTRLRTLERRLERDGRVVSPYGGKLVDLMITPHALIDKGAPAALLQPERQDDPMEAIVFVPAGLGKKIAAGDAVEVCPDTVRRQEHGYVEGTVDSVSEIPATEMAMVAELKHRTLVSSFMSQYAGQVLLSIHVRLPDVRRHGDARRRTTAAPVPRQNWLVWSSSSGAGQRVSSGTLCSASIVVEKRPLIALVIPWLKEQAGIY